jgi:hypothetical protein
MPPTMNTSPSASSSISMTPSPNAPTDRQGFANNNSIGCVKDRDNINYWKRVRKYYPEAFRTRAAQERKFSVAINRITRKGVRFETYLDEIEEGDPKGDDFAVTCGLFRMSEADNFQTNAEVTGDQNPTI